MIVLRCREIGEDYDSQVVHELLGDEIRHWPQTLHTTNAHEHQRKHRMELISHQDWPLRLTAEVDALPGPE
jgi:hypothetical protein